MQFPDATWRNFAGTQSCTPSAYVRADDVDDVVDAVDRARHFRQSVRPIGAGHSYSPVIPTDGLIIDLSNLSGILSVDASSHRIHVGAGTTIAALGGPLWDKGLALSNQGDIDSQTVAGAVSTATHGSGLNYGSFSSVVVGMTLVTASGEVRRLTQQDVELAAASTAVGTFGVMTSVELQVMGAYQLVEQNMHARLGDVCERWMEDVKSRRHYSFFWGPYSDSLPLYELPRAATAGDDCYVKRYDQIGPDEVYDVRPGERVDRSYRIYADVYPPSFDELEYFVPIELTIEALRSLETVLRLHPDQRHPVEVRAVKAENSLMSGMYERDSASISVSGLVGTDYESFLRDVDFALRDFDARPHWGKVHFFDARRLAAVFPDSYERFRATRRDFDPDGMFLNEHTGRLFND